jgi:hypothetical protein
MTSALPLMLALSACAPDDEPRPAEPALPGALSLGPGLDDDFSGSQLDPSWSNLRPGVVSVAVTGGALHLRSVQGQNAVWFNTSTETLIYKLVASSNFKVTTTARPRKRTDPNVAPTNPLHVGGLMVRDPSSNGGSTENYLFIMAGSNEGAVPGIEVKSTTNSLSTFFEPAWSNPLAADLRICRLGGNFHVYKRVPGTTSWIPAQSDPGRSDPTESRPDLPATLQVGLALNYLGPDNDLDVAFDGITFAPATSLADCTTDLPTAPAPPVPALSTRAFGAAMLVLLAAGVTILARRRRAPPRGLRANNALCRQL